MSGTAALVAALLCLAAGLACLGLAAAGVGERPAQLAHAAMGAGMAGMFSPWGDPLPAWLGAGAFAVVAAWFGAALLRGARGAAVHLTVSSAAMALMYLAHPAAAPGAAAGGGHAGHHMGGGVPALAVLPVTLLLAGYFAWHAWTCAEQVRGAGPVLASPGTPAAALPRPRVPVEPLAHGAMSVLMAAMFLGAV